MTYLPGGEALRYLIDAGKVRATEPASQSKPRRRNSIDDLLSEKVECLATILRDIQSKIDKRHDLSGNVIGLIYQHYLYIKAKLLKMDHWPVDSVRAIEQRRSGLETQLDTLLNEKRREQVQCWQDIADLKKEFWKWFKQYCDVAQRVGLVLGHDRD